MKTSGFLLAAALALAPAAALGQPAPAAPAAAPLADADPALWVVRDADTTVYLFGTFHLLDGRPWFNDEIRTAFDSSDELVTEAVLPEDPASLQPLILRYAVDPEGRTLSSRLDAGQNAALARALSAAGIPPAAFDRFEPWFVSMTLAVLGAQRLGIGSDSGPETVLTAAARARGIPVRELEGFELQLRLLDTMPEAMQIAQLADTLEQNDAIAGKLAPMLAAWSAGDVERLGALLNEEEHGLDRAPRGPAVSGEHGGPRLAGDLALRRLLFTGRNARWAQWIAARMARPGTVFVAVGAGHLAGPDSVRHLITAYGLAAERVPHSEAP